MNEPVTVRLRCLAVAGVATGSLAALAAFLSPGLVAATATGPAGSTAGGVGDPPFEDLLVTGCAAVALVAGCWLWALTCLVALPAARGRAAATRGVPTAVRRLVLVACGVALTGTATVPAGAAPGTPGGIAGLPFPDRATGVVSAAARTPTVRLPRATGSGHPAGADPAPAAGVVVVRRGDTLWGLAVRHLPPGARASAVTACWQRIHELNRDVIGDDPDLIRPGQRLRLPRH